MPPGDLKESINTGPREMGALRRCFRAQLATANEVGAKLSAARRLYDLAASFLRKGRVESHCSETGST